MTNTATENNITGKKLLSINETATYIGMGINRTRELMDKVGATCHIGRRVLFNKAVIDRYIDSITGTEADNI